MPRAFNTYIAVVLSVQPCCNYFVIGTLWDFAICASVMCNLCYCFYSTSPESWAVLYCISSTNLTSLFSTTLCDLIALWEGGRRSTTSLKNRRSQTKNLDNLYFSKNFREFNRVHPVPSLQSHLALPVHSDGIPCAIHGDILGEETGSKTLYSEVVLPMECLAALISYK